jgi:hypothetical protein
VVLVVELAVVLVVERVEVEAAGVVEDVDTDVLEDCATELPVLVVELAELTELADVEVCVVVPLDGGAEAR